MKTKKFNTILKKELKKDSFKKKYDGELLKLKNKNYGKKKNNKI